ncbi:hypothetical protein [Glaciihabitans sp. dw_435]|uniref:hypothetical protein n=1 Tax=Glaciihabitans sp. dw_435 TaxID=2720081 RepID=UPI001BD20714|nr:hypothetical protein [Glaciihabitans sp. dw_435]
MDVALLVPLVLIAALIVVLGATAFIPRFRTVQLRRWTRSTGLAITPDVRHTVGERVTVRTKVTFLLVAAAVAVTAFLWSIANSEEVGPPPGIQLPLAIAALILSLIMLIGPYGAPRSSMKDRGLKLRDYIPIQVRILAFTTMTVALTVVVVTAILLWGSRAISTAEMAPAVLAASPLLVSLLWFAAALALTPRAIRRVEWTTNDQQLAWNDAFTSQALFSGYLIPQIISLTSMPSFALAVTTIARDTTARDAVFTLSNYIFLADLVLLLTYVFVITIGAPSKHYLRRIWPNARMYGDGMIADGNVPEPVWPADGQLAPAPEPSTSPLY